MADPVQYPKFMYAKGAWVNRDDKSEQVEVYNQRLSPNFEVAEFHCPCTIPTCTFTLISPDLVDVLQNLHNVMNEALFVTSGFRCVAHNATLPLASKSSQHMWGMAADFHTFDRDNLRHAIPILLSFAKVGALGQYFKDGRISRLHVDVRPRDPMTGVKQWRIDL